MGKPATKSRAAKVRLEVHASRFELKKLPVGYVTTDHKTDLQWSHTLGSASFNDAQGVVDQLNAAKHDGHADWRLPTVEELFCIADRSKYSPAIDTEAFPDTKSDWYWSSTQYAPLSGCAWIVDFSHGFSYDAHHGGRHCVRAVRPSQPLASRK